MSKYDFWIPISNWPNHMFGIKSKNKGIKSNIIIKLLLTLILVFIYFSKVKGYFSKMWTSPLSPIFAVQQIAKYI